MSRQSLVAAGVGAALVLAWQGSALGASESRTTGSSSSRSTVQARASQALSVLVLGDSYSSGNGAGHYYASRADDKACLKSRRNYGNEFARLVSARTGTKVSVTTEACSGAVTADYWKSRDGRPAQRVWVRKDQDLILLTFGGNDIGFGKVKDQCLVGPSVQVERCAASLRSASQALDSGTVQNRVAAVLADIKKSAAPSTRIVLLGYPFVEGDPTLTFGPLALGKLLRTIGIRGDAAAQAAVAEANAGDAAGTVVFVSTQALFSGRSPWLTTRERVRHELFKQKVNAARWMIQPFTDAGAQDPELFYHPNPTGWTREAMLLMQTLKWSSPTSFRSLSARTP